jgi:hypothetical protein
VQLFSLVFRRKKWRSTGHGHEWFQQVVLLQLHH